MRHTILKIYSGTTVNITWVSQSAKDFRSYVTTGDPDLDAHVPTTLIAIYSRIRDSQYSGFF